MKRTIITICVGFVMGLVLLTGAPVWADTIDINAPSDDSYIRGGNYANNNYGTQSDLDVGDDYNAGYGAAAYTYCRKIYMRFSTTSITNTVTNATLELTLANATNLNWKDVDLKVYGLNDLTTGETTWTEGGITWNNAPGNDNTMPPPTGGSGFVNATELGTISVPKETTAGSTLSLSTAALASFLNADTNNEVTIMIHASVVDGDNPTILASKENTTYGAPSLSVTVVPEPATIGLIVFGIIGFIRRK